MKGIVRIGGALAVGIVIILGALTVQKNAGGEALAGQVIVSTESTREFITSTDADNNGVTDWKESLPENSFESIDTPTSDAEETEPYQAPTTLTGKFSEAFLQDYLEGKMQGADYADPTQFVENAVAAIDTNAQSTRHTRAELQIISDSEDALHTYGNDLAFIVKTHSIANENEAVILQKALTANDPKILEDLAPIHAAYRGFIDDTLRTEVPQSLVSEHITLLNAYEAIITDIEAMQMAFSDPLYSLARVRGYEVDVKVFSAAFQAIERALSAQGISYTSDELGAFLYLFDS